MEVMNVTGITIINIGLYYHIHYSKYFPAIIYSHNIYRIENFTERTVLCNFLKYLDKPDETQI